MHRSLMLVGACIAAVVVPRPVDAQSPSAATIPLGVVAEKLGVKPSPGAPRELDLGASATGMLAEPQKVTEYGAKGFHEGARVTITCIAPARLRVEVEEMEPVAARVIITLHVGEDGSLTKVSDRAPSKPPAT